MRPVSRDDVDLVRSLVPTNVDWAAIVRDDDRARELGEASRSLFAPDFRCALVGITDESLTGFDGLRSVWLEWLKPWASYRVQEEEIIDLGEGRVLWLGHDIGGRRDGPGEIVLRSSAIWTVVDGRIAEVLFYAERRRALRDAGIHRDELAP